MLSKFIGKGSITDFLFIKGECSSGVLISVSTTLHLEQLISYKQSQSWTPSCSGLVSGDGLSIRLAGASIAF
jgi:hypothetical protein